MIFTKKKKYNFQKIAIKKINLHINNGIINNFINSEKKKRKFTNSVDFLNNRRDKVKYSERKEDNNIFYKNKSHLENALSSYKKSLYYNYDDNNKILSLNNNDNYNNYKENKNYNIINNKNEPQNNIKTIYLNNNNYLHSFTKNDLLEEEKEKEKRIIQVRESIKNIRVNLKPFLQKINIKSLNKNLDKFINTEYNMNQIFTKKNNEKYNENKNITTIKNEYSIYKNNKIINSFHDNDYNVKKSDNNKYKRYSSCDRCYGEIKSYLYNDNFENDYRKNNKNFSIRRNYCNLKKINENIYTKSDDIYKENDSFVNNSILNNENSFKKRNENEVNLVSKSIEEIPKKNNLKLYNLNRFTYNNNNYKNNTINTIIFEKGKNEQQLNNLQSENIFRTAKKSENIKNHRFNTIERFYENKNIKARIETNNKDNEIVKNSNIRNYYKQRIASVNKILDKSSKIVL